MLELLYKIFIGHAHKYEIINRDLLETYSKASDPYPTDVVETITQRCSICGKIKVDKVKKK